MADQPDKYSSAPKHVAIIMDGNGRWAKKRGKLRTFGHKAGVDSVRDAVQFAIKNNIKSLTLFAFSSENWQRPESEVSVLMDLFLNMLTIEVTKLHKNEIKLNIIGELSRFSEKLQRKIAEAEALTSANSKLTLNIAANYGGQWDITHAVKKIAEKVAERQLSPADISQQMVAEHLCLAEQPVIDLLIRTGGEHRVSNFLLWQIAYAELYFTDLLWPDFNESEFEKAIQCFVERERRFGKTSDQLQTIDA